MSVGNFRRQVMKNVSNWIQGNANKPNAHTPSYCQFIHDASWLQTARIGAWASLLGQDNKHAAILMHLDVLPTWDYLFVLLLLYILSIRPWLSFSFVYFPLARRREDVNVVQRKNNKRDPSMFLKTEHCLFLSSPLLRLSLLFVFGISFF